MAKKIKADTTASSSTAGFNYIFGTGKADTLNGTPGDDYIIGRNGADTVDGIGGNDVIAGGNGNDDLTGGTGRDYVYGQNGDDILRYAYEQTTARDYYNGGNGFDTLALSFTSDEWRSLNGADDALLTDIREFRDFLQTGSNAYGYFETFSLGVQDFEAVIVTVDGEEVDLDDQAVTATDDAVTVREDAAPVTIDVLDNDETPDGFRSLALATQPELGAVTLEGNAFVFDAGADFQYLGGGETETVSFTYDLADADGDTAQATVQVTVEGENDGPTSEDVTVRIAERDSNVEPTTIDDGARTVVNAGGFYILDTDTGELDFSTRGDIGLTPDAVAPSNGVVVYINPNTSNWFVEAHLYADGVASPIAPADLDISGYEGETLLRDDAYFFLEDSSDVSINIQVPEFGTPDGAATGSIALTGLGYVANATKTVDVGSFVVEIAPANVEPAIEIAPVTADAEGDELSVSVDTDDTAGTVTVTEDGTFLYDQGNAFGALAEGEMASDTFTYTVDDGNGGTSTSTVTVEVEGTNDGPDAVALNAEVYAEAASLASFDASTPVATILNAGTFYVLDYDAGTVDAIQRGGSLLTVQDVAPQNGIALLVNPNTNSTYLDATYYENGTETVVDPTALMPMGYEGEFDIYGNRLILLDAVDDGTISVVVEELATSDGLARAEITLTGFDYEGPGLTQVVTVDGASASISEAPIDLSVTVTAEVSDPDDDVFTFTFTVDATDTLGSVVNNGDGTFTYTTDGAFDALMAGETATDTFSYTVFDAAGAFDTEMVMITAIGTVDDMLLA